jgi:hypothetical protein
MTMEQLLAELRRDKDERLAGGTYYQQIPRMRPRLRETKVGALLDGSRDADWEKY